MFRKKASIQIKSADQLAVMRQAGLVVATALKAVSEAVRPGVTTADLDAIAHQVMRDASATPSFLGYHGYPAAICASINEEVVHGIPSPRRLLEGDLISIDCGAIVDGWHGDAAVSVFVGEPSTEIAELSRVTEASMWAGLAQARAGNHLSDIGHAIENCIRSQSDYGIVEEYSGHGIGTSMHMPPSIPNYGEPGHGPLLKVGMALAIEPMATLGSPVVEVLADGWTVVTSDRAWASHWEHTVAITEDGPWILTSLDEVRL
ncbi:MAG: type I methionyl aminopeptidase [Actinomycetota bacterium]|nr:type I methionyl aminopeptidase [Actinomycetota bacterium]